MNLLFLMGTVISFILAGYIMWLHGIKPRITNIESKDFDKFRNEVTKLITDFNRVANTNINILEEKIEDLKDVIKLADDKILRLNSKLTDLEILANRNKKPLIKEVEEIIPKKKIKPLSSKATLNEKKERIKELVREGLPIEEIAKAVNMSQGEVQLVVELKNKR